MIKHNNIIISLLLTNNNFVATLIESYCDICDHLVLPHNNYLYLSGYKIYSYIM